MFLVSTKQRYGLELQNLCKGNCETFDMIVVGKLQQHISPNSGQFQWLTVFFEAILIIIGGEFNWCQTFVGISNGPSILHTRAPTIFLASFEAFIGPASTP